jgi:hypothetical protein
METHIVALAVMVKRILIVRAVSAKKTIIVMDVNADLIPLYGAAEMNVLRPCVVINFQRPSLRDQTANHKRRTGSNVALHRLTSALSNNLLRRHVRQPEVAAAEPVGQLLGPLDRWSIRPRLAPARIEITGYCKAMDNGHEPATKGDISELRSELKGDISELRSELKGDISEVRAELKGDISRLGDELREAIHDAETRLLKAFYSFAESNQKRISMV